MVADLGPKLQLPLIALELVFGILIGPPVLGWAQPVPALTPLVRLGIAFLFFHAGMEMDFKAMSGAPLRTATLGWLFSMGLALCLGWLLMETGVISSALIVGAALTTTALGTLLPILRDAGHLGSRFGTFVIAAGTLGEFGPIALISVVLTAQDPGQRTVSTGLLLAFGATIFVCARLATRVRPGFLVSALERKLHTSAQLPVRLSLLVLATLAILTGRIGLDSVLGAIAAGVLVNLTCQGEMGEAIRHKLEAIGFGFFVPIFFVVTGIKFNLAALTQSPGALLQVPLFLLLFLIARGLPALLYRGAMPPRDQLALALLSATALPLVVAITEVGLETGRIGEENATALVSAGLLSVLIFPSLALVLLRRQVKVPR
jgi:Kef-type K+ transport system membrane component KefB